MRETMVTVVGSVVGTVRTTRVGEDRMRASFRVASTARRFDKRTQEWGDGDSLYVTVVSWGRLAEGVGSSLTKGDPVIVQGRLFSREWTDDTGRNRSVVEMEAVAVGPDLTRSTATVRRWRADAAVSNGTEPTDGAVADGRPDGDDVPGPRGRDDAGSGTAGDVNADPDDDDGDRDPGPDGGAFDDGLRLAGSSAPDRFAALAAAARPLVAAPA